MNANAICKNCGKPVENTSGVLLHIRDGMEFVNETLPDKKRCFMFAALALPEAQPTPEWIEERKKILALNPTAISRELHLAYLQQGRREPTADQGIVAALCKIEEILTHEPTPTKKENA